MSDLRAADPGPLDGSLSAPLPAAAIRIGAVAEDWRSAVRIAGDALVASEATLDGYTDEMIATVEEFGPYIVIAPGIALAHSRPSAAVRRAGLSVVTLAWPVEFGHRDNDPVSPVVGLAAPDAESHLAALATLADFLSDEGRREAMLAAPTAEAIRAMVVAFESQTANPG